MCSAAATILQPQTHITLDPACFLLFIAHSEAHVLIHIHIYGCSQRMYREMLVKNSNVGMFYVCGGSRFASTLIPSDGRDDVSTAVKISPPVVSFRRSPVSVQFFPSGGPTRLPLSY